MERTDILYLSSENSLLIAVTIFSLTPPWLWALDVNPGLAQQMGQDALCSFAIFEA